LPNSNAVAVPLFERLHDRVERSGRFGLKRTVTPQFEEVARGWPFGEAACSVPGSDSPNGRHGVRLEIALNEHGHWVQTTSMQVGESRRLVIVPGRVNVTEDPRALVDWLLTVTGTTWDPETWVHPRGSGQFRGNSGDPLRVLKRIRVLKHKRPAFAGLFMPEEGLEPPTRGL
jgi:hypothetical protein